MASIPLDVEVLAPIHNIKPTNPLHSTLSQATINAFTRVQPPQTSHRINILKSFLNSTSDLQGKKVLELGCGQGDASVVLAAAVSGGNGQGKIAAWDPASPDYGMSTP